jgi:glycosyltransferase involved in cell wall biosynthesis
MNNDIHAQNAENPCVSVIVPIYKVEQYLHQCVNSLLCQTLKNIEIILINDGSPDNCPAMCDTYAEQDKRVKVVHQQNGGYGKACNAGFIVAKGEYIGIVEPDDYAELTMMERLYHSAKEHNLDIARCHNYLWDSRANTRTCVDLSSVPQNTVFSPKNDSSVFFSFPSVWSMIYKADFLKNNGINFFETPGASYQDTSFLFKVYACAEKIMLIEDVLINYRIDNNNSSVKSREKAFCICDEYSEVVRFTKEHNVYNELKFLIVRKKFRGYLWNYKRIDRKLKLQFLQVFSKEMREHIAKGEIDKRIFSKKSLLRLYIIAYCYVAYHVKMCFG